MSETHPHTQGTSVTLHQKLADVLTHGQVLKVVTKLTLRVTPYTRKSKKGPLSHPPSPNTEPKHARVIGESEYQEPPHNIT